MNSLRTCGTYRDDERMKTALAGEPSLEDDARRATLQRLATGLAVIAEPDQYHWTCCWQDFRHGRNNWTWQFCNKGMPGRYTVPCEHWHHQFEVFLARGEAATLARGSRGLRCLNGRRA